MAAAPVFLDTDIGDDIDDAYALALILASPELELRGISTVFRNTAARTRQARTLLKLAGRTGVPVASGCAGVLSPRIDYSEGPVQVDGRPVLQPFADAIRDTPTPQDAASLAEDELPATDPRSGATLMIDAIRSGNGEVIPVTIGALTNLAVALVSDPRIIPMIPRVIAMAGWFSEERPEWNVRCDPVAAAVVCASGVPVTFVGLDVTLQCVFTPDDLERLFAAGDPVCRHLSDATRAWQAHTAHRRGHAMPVLHDPLAVATLINPGLVKTEQGTVDVGFCGDCLGRTRFTPGAGPHSICTAVRGREAIDLWLARVTGDDDARA